MTLSVRGHRGRETLSVRGHRGRETFSVRGHHGRDCMIVEFTTTNAISAYHH